MGVAEARAPVGSWGPEPPQIFGASWSTVNHYLGNKFHNKFRLFNVPLLIWNANID